VDVDLSKPSGKIRRVNVTVPERVLALIDEAARRDDRLRSSGPADDVLEVLRGGELEGRQDEHRHEQHGPG
jgi:hypothetical protein